MYLFVSPSFSLCLSLCLCLCVSIPLCLFLYFINSEVVMLHGCFHRAFESQLSSGISIRLHLLPELCANSNIQGSEKRSHKTFLSDLKSHMIQTPRKRSEKGRKHILSGLVTATRNFSDPLVKKPAPACASCPRCSFPNTRAWSTRRTCQPGF